MPYEQSKFGDGSTAGSGNVTSVVSNHYGPRDTGGEQGQTRHAGAEKESTVNFTGEGPLYDTQSIPVGAVITEVLGLGLTGAIATATVGAVDISGANGAVANYVVISTAGDLAVTGPTAGKVLVKWTKLA